MGEAFCGLAERALAVGGPALAWKRLRCARWRQREWAAADRWVQALACGCTAWPAT